MNVLTRAPTPGATSTSADGPARWTQVDYLMILITLGLALFGCVMVFSTTRGTDEVANTAFVQRQVIAIVLGLVGAYVAAVIDFRRLLALLPIGYAGTVLMLVAVLAIGEEVNGAKAWFRFGPLQLQPSEFGKVIFIMLLASVLGTSGGHELRPVLTALVAAAVPIGLVTLQPDVGTVLVYVAILIVALVIAGVSGRLLLTLAAAGVLVVVLATGSGLLATYQIERLTTFVDEDCDTDIRACYNVEQAKIAIGNGGLTGDGLFDGAQTQSGLVPEQQTDFIFTAVGEELGFAGGALLLSMYAILLMRMWRVANLAPDRAGTIVCVGVIAMIVFQMFQNIGMNLGMMPVTGIPLPLISYGGSSVIATLVSVGLVQNVHFRRFT